MKGTWIETYTGKKFYALDPREADICIEDIAHSLAHQCRFTGHPKRFYSVAQHSIELSVYSQLRGEPDSASLYWLLHDAHEAYVGDMSSPMKQNLEELGLLEAWNKVVHNINGVIFKKYGILDAVIRDDYDKRILLDEKKEFFPDSKNNWGLDLVPLGISIDVMSDKMSEYLFLKRFKQLYG